MKDYVDVLGVRYKIEIRNKEEDSFLKSGNFDGYCSYELKLIVVSDMKEFENIDESEKKIYQRDTLRHEVVHAFLDESGLQSCSMQYCQAWAKNEEMVDWIAIQFPKILEAYKWLEVI